MARRIVAHLDLDAFYVSVELLRRPELRGQPVIVSGSGPRAVVTTASYEARVFGVHSAMPTSQARRRCPRAILVPPDFAVYRDASRRVWELVRERVAMVEQMGLDEGYLDLSGLIAPKAAMRRLVGELRAATGLGASVGIGPNKLVAKIASDCEKPGGLVALSREMACERFADASPRLLPGVGPKTAERLEAMGIRTVAALRAHPVADLRVALGERQGAFLRRRAHFDDEGIVAPVRETKSQSSETTFDHDLADRAEQARVIDRLSEDLCARLQRRELRGRTIGIKVRLEDWTTVTRARTLDDPTNEPAAVRTVARELLAAYD
ncbi:MAG: DNA polymerase IV, partial [Actinomycetota bacterium]|nr:DNA polymerase IV [Actinomycetota bacterium]